jgi:hypothetical protein
VNFFNVFSELYFPFAQKNHLYKAFWKFLLLNVFSADGLLGLFSLHAEVSVGDFVNWSESHRSLMFLRKFIWDTALCLANNICLIFPITCMYMTMLLEATLSFFYFK